MLNEGREKEVNPTELLQGIQTTVHPPSSPIMVIYYHLQYHLQTHKLKG